MLSLMLQCSNDLLYNRTWYDRGVDGTAQIGSTCLGAAEKPRSQGAPNALSGGAAAGDLELPRRLQHQSPGQHHGDGKAKAEIG